MEARTQLVLNTRDEPLHATARRQLTARHPKVRHSGRAPAVRPLHAFLPSLFPLSFRARRASVGFARLDAGRQKAGGQAGRQTGATGAAQRAFRSFARSLSQPAPCHSCSRCAAAAAATAAVLLLDSTLLPHELPPLKLPLRPPLELTPHTRPQHSAPLSPLPASKRTNERRTSDRLSQQLRANPPLLPSPPPPLQQPPPPAVASLARSSLAHSPFRSSSHSTTPHLVAAALSPTTPEPSFSRTLAGYSCSHSHCALGGGRQAARLRSPRGRPPYPPTTRSGRWRG